jgi:hypothetical protein
MTEAVADRPRPAVVTAAVAVLYGLAVLAAVDLVISVVSWVSLLTTDHEVWTTAVWVAVGLFAAVELALPFVFVLIAQRVGRGRSRALAWTAAPLVAICCCGRLNNAYLNGYLSTAASGGFSGSLGWLPTVRIWVTVLGMAGLFAVVLLLALPAAARFFQPDEYWVKPTG